MTKFLTAPLIAAAFAAPAQAGPTEQALARCTAAAQASAPGATILNRKIVEGGRQTKISLWVKSADKRAFDCTVSARGELVAAYADPARSSALATAQ